MSVFRFAQAHWRRVPAAVWIVIVFSTGFAVGNLRLPALAQNDDTQAPPGLEEEFAAFWQVYNLIQNEALQAPDAAALIDGAAAGLVEALDDPYSGYMPPGVYDLLNSDLEGEIQGIGVVIRTNEDDSIEVVGLLEGAPAQSAGILPGDFFFTVDGEPVSEMTQLDLAANVRGEEGSTVEITMLRGEELIDFTVVRARIVIPNIESRLVDSDRYAYIKLNSFTAAARADLEQAMTDLDIDSREGLIIDFRGNPGGYLTSAIDVASLFIGSGPVVIEDFGDGNTRTFDAQENARTFTTPIVLLVDESSASASELVAGALQDTGTATIIGETTLGKGTVQTWRELVNGGGVRLTIARWLTPNGRWIHENGVTPDYIAEWTPEMYNDPNDLQLEAAIDYLDATIAGEAVPLMAATRIAGDQVGDGASS